jgi:ribosomal protein S18 acetylase RimI-like enzyme
MKCSYCKEDAVYTCSVCGKPTCLRHTRFRTTCPSCIKTKTAKFRINDATSDDKTQIRKLVTRFWGEQEQLTFDRTFNVTKLPAYAARIDENVVAFLSYAEADDAIIIVALGMLPQYQNQGVGRQLIEKVEDKARTRQKKEILVSTSNDDLPALAFYQSLGFQIYDVKPNLIAEKHGRVQEGIGGLPVRDELRLRKIVAI